MKFPLGEMTVGDILDRGIRLLFARLPAYYTINLLILAPVMVLQVALPFVMPEPVPGANQLDPAVAVGALGGLAFVVLVTIILQPIGTAAILHIIMEEYAGRKVGIGDALSYAMGRFLSLIGASIVVGFLIVIGFMLCCLPGIYLAVTYAFVSQIVVLERLGVGDSLNRSTALVTGHRWRVFGVLFLIGLANGIVQGGFAVAMNTVLPAREIIPGPNGPQIQFNAVNHVVDTVAGQLVGILFSTYIAVCVTLLYLDLRIRKEGFDLELAGGGPPRPRLDDDGYDDRPRRRDDDGYDDDYDRDLR